MVALVRAEVIAEAVDALGKQSDLDFGRTSVIGGALELRDHTGFFVSGEGHQVRILTEIFGRFCGRGFYRKGFSKHRVTWRREAGADEAGKGHSPGPPQCPQTR